MTFCPLRIAATVAPVHCQKCRSPSVMPILSESSGTFTSYCGSACSAGRGVARASSSLVLRSMICRPISVYCRNSVCSCFCRSTCSPRAPTVSSQAPAFSAERMTVPLPSRVLTIPTSDRSFSAFRTVSGET